MKKFVYPAVIKLTLLAENEHQAREFLRKICVSLFKEKEGAPELSDWGIRAGGVLEVIEWDEEDDDDAQ